MDELLGLTRVIKIQCYLSVSIPLSCVCVVFKVQVHNSWYFVNIHVKMNLICKPKLFLCMEVSFISGDAE